MKFIGQTVIAVAVYIIVFLSENSSEQNLESDTFVYNPDSISHNEKILRLFVKLTSNTADHINYLKRRASENSKNGNAAKDTKNKVETSKSATSVVPKSDKSGNQVTPTPEWPKESVKKMADILRKESMPGDDTWGAKNEPNLNPINRININNEDDNNKNSKGGEKVRESKWKGAQGKSEKQQSTKNGLPTTSEPLYSTLYRISTTHSTGYSVSPLSSTTRKTIPSNVLEDIKMNLRNLDDENNDNLNKLLRNRVVIDENPIPVLQEVSNRIDLGGAPELMGKSFLNMLPAIGSAYSTYQAMKNLIPIGASFNQDTNKTDDKSNSFLDLFRDSTKLNVLKIIANIFSVLRPYIQDSSNSN